MKTFLLLSIFINSCNHQVPKYMHGYIFTKDIKPSKGMRIQDPYDKKNFSITNDEGYFKMEQLTKAEYLYVFTDYKKIDSLYVVRTHPERGESYYFVEGRKDTLFLNTKH